MLPVTCKITLEQRDYLDSEIKKGNLASYGHSLRFFMGWYKKYKRVLAKQSNDIAILRADNERLKGNGYVQEKGTEVIYDRAGTNEP